MKLIGYILFKISQTLQTHPNTCYNIATMNNKTRTYKTNISRYRHHKHANALRKQSSKNLLIQLHNLYHSIMNKIHHSVREKILNMHRNLTNNFSSKTNQYPTYAKVTKINFFQREKSDLNNSQTHTDTILRSNLPKVTVM